MKSRALVLAAFAALVLVQLAVPASMIMKRESTLRTGERFLFKTAPIDPYDAFRGRYVWLSFEAATATISGETFESGQRIFASIATDDEGFAYFTTASAAPPDSGPYLAMKVSYTGVDDTVTLQWPLDRFYMDEHLAPEAERTYFEMNRADETETDVYAAVRIKNGFPVIENLFIDDVPIAEYVQREPPAE